ncbi:MAG: hypothetical protein WKH64_02535 [Chloroflexia bacterium]
MRPQHMTGGCLFVWVLHWSVGFDTYVQYYYSSSPTPVWESSAAGGLPSSDPPATRETLQDAS